MANEELSAWTPEWAIPPGELLAEVLEDRELSQSELARRIDRPIKTVNEIIKGKAAITAETAIQLEYALGIKANFWISAESRFREFQARQSMERELDEASDWLKCFPVKDLARFGLVGKKKSDRGMITDLLAFFGTSSVNAWEKIWLEPQASFRRSQAYERSPFSVASWLRWGEVQAARIECDPYDEGKFREALDQIRFLTKSQPFSTIIRRVQEMCAACGVAVITTPEFSGTSLSGAARWLSPTKALIQLSLRHKSDDQFWFSFFHEGGHVLRGAKRTFFVDGADEDAPDDDLEEERHANHFARNVLIPEAEYAEFLTSGAINEKRIREFADRLGIASGIVVGRLQKDNEVPKSHFNSLKRKITWA